MKIDFNKPLCGLDGQPLVNSPTDPTLSNLGKIIADAIAKSSSDEPLKSWCWAKALYSGEPLDLDLSDTEKFTTAIKALKVSDLVKGQALEIILAGRHGGS